MLGSKFRAGAVVIGAVMIGAVLAGGRTADASTTAGIPAGGTVHIYVSTAGRGERAAPILLTGAIGDYGTATSVTKAGKVDAHGTYVKVALKKGAFRSNATLFDTNLGKVTPSFNPTTCSRFSTASGKATLYEGSGLYKGVSGTAHLTETVAAITPRLSNGSCDTSANAQPISEYSFITGTAAVKF